MVIRLLIHPGATPKGGHGESFVAKKKKTAFLLAILCNLVGCCWMLQDVVGCLESSHWDPGMDFFHSIQRFNMAIVGNYVLDVVRSNH